MAYNSFAEFYDSLTANIDYEEIAGYYDRLNEKFGGIRGILLDLACGTGSLSVIFSKMGYDVIGTDISPEMLSIAVSKQHEGIEYLCQNMTELDMFGTIDGTVCSLDSINHLENAEQVRRTFEKVSLFMNKGGAFAFDVNTLHKHKNVLADNTFVYDLDELYCVWQNSYNESDGSVDITLDFFEEDDGTYYRSGESFTEQAYDLDDIAKWLEEAGFEVIGIFDDMTTEKAHPETERAVFLAKKK